MKKVNSIKTVLPYASLPEIMFPEVNVNCGSECIAPSISMAF